MALEFETVIEDITNLNMWYKLQSGSELFLSDVPEILNYRWPYFRDNWEQIRDSYIDVISSYPDPDKLRLNIDSFTEFIKTQRISKSNRNPFDNSDTLIRFYAIFDTTPINNIVLSFEETQIIENKTREINSYTRSDFLNIRSKLQSERDAIADKVGKTDEDYNRVFDRSAQPARVSVKNADINKIYNINEGIKSIDFILANSFSLSSSFVDPFALARQNANNPEIEIGSYASGTLVKINYGEDLRSLALRTLGDESRWIDIAIANGLKAPYIDEKGNKIPLISNASGNQINIAAKDNNNELNIDKMFIGQLVLLSSSVETFPDQRKILNIREVPVSGEIIIELDGEPDLDKYKLSDGAIVRIYKPNTINSSFFVLIPSEEELDSDFKTDTPWFLQSNDLVERNQKVDISINGDGDLDFNSTGDLQLSYGLQNSVQAIKLKLSVEQGELRRHPSYGLTAIQGSLNNNINSVQEILTQSVVDNIEADERFAGINNLDVVYVSPDTGNDATGFYVNMTVNLANSNQTVPISFSVNI